MFTVYLNIGLYVGTTTQAIPAETALADTLAHMGRCGMRVKCYSWRVIRDEQEPTLVVSLTLTGTTWRIAQALDGLAVLLQQEAIAAYVPDLHKGFLRGPKAAEWGEFAPALFIMPNPSDVCEVPQERAA